MKVRTYKGRIHKTYTLEEKKRVIGHWKSEDVRNMRITIMVLSMRYGLSRHDIRAVLTQKQANLFAPTWRKWSELKRTLKLNIKH